MARFTLTEATSSSAAAVAQSPIMFVLEPETFPVFVAWLRERFADKPAEWFAPELVRKDLEQAMATLCEIGEISRVLGIG